MRPGSHAPVDAASVEPFWGGPLTSCCAALATDGLGLSHTQARARLDEYGANRLGTAPASRFLRQVVQRLGNPLVLLLLFAAGVAAATGDRASFLLVTLVVATSVTLDAFQEHRAGRAAERLQASVAIRARVVRDGVVCEVPRDEVVPGDVVELAAGSLVPADGRVLEADDCFVNQATITGEAFPVEKHAVDLPDGSHDPSVAMNALFMGTSLVSGSARMLVCRTGAATLLGGIGESLRHAPPATAFELGLRDFGLLVLRVALGMVLFVLLVNALQHRPWLQSFLFAVALAVGLTPELLPMIVTVTLSRGALRMAKQRVIVKRLGAVHDLGAMDVLCTDKTGTLTEAAVRIARGLDAQGRPSERVLRWAWLNSRLETGLRSPLDDAILAQSDMSLDGWRKIDEVPFDFERRRLSVLADDGDRRVLIVKGAFEDVLRLSAEIETEVGGTAPLEDDLRERCRERVAALGREGLRVLGVAWKRTAVDHPHAVVDDESALVLAGIVAFEDPPKASASAALADLAKDGVRVKLVTGDDERVTRHLCEALDFPVTGVLTGQDLDGLADPAFALRCEEANVFCRVSPALKSRIIRALRQRGHVVGYLGDGINDAPALHAADVGLSVDGAVDVAREAADLILLEHDLAVVHRGVREGRRTFGNILKYLLMGTSSNFGNMLSMALGTLILPFLPLLPVQVLVNNLLYDLSEVSIPLDHVEAEVMRRPHRFDIRHLRDFMLVVGPVSSVFDLATFLILLHGFRAGPALFHTGWFVESMATQVLVVLIIRTPGAPWRTRPHPLLIGTAFAVVGVALALPWTGFGRDLGFVPLPASYLGLVALMVVTYLAVVEVVKRRFYQRIATS